MVAKFLENVEINDGKRKRTVNKGEIFTVANEDKDFYELRHTSGWGTMAPKSEEGKIYEIMEEA